MTSADTCNSNIERAVLGILNGLETFHYCCYTYDVSHKLLVAMFKKDVASLPLRLQGILLWIHQYNVRMVYKPGLQVLIAYWLSRHNYDTNSDEDISGIYIIINAVESCTDIPDCMTAGEIREVTLEGEHLSALADFILCVCPSTETGVQRKSNPIGHSGMR